MFVPVPSHSLLPQVKHKFGKFKRTSYDQTSSDIHGGRDYRNSIYTIISIKTYYIFNAWCHLLIHKLMKKLVTSAFPIRHPFEITISLYLIIYFSILFRVYYYYSEVVFRMQVLSKWLQYLCPPIDFLRILSCKYSFLNIYWIKEAPIIIAFVLFAVQIFWKLNIRET